MDCQILHIFMITLIWEVATCLCNFYVRRLFMKTSF